MKSSILRVPIDELHDTQIGFRFSNVNAPPFDSAMLCPHEKFSCVISVNLQHRHRVLPTLSPIWLFHTLRFNARGIDRFLAAGGFGIAAGVRARAVGDTGAGILSSPDSLDFFDADAIGGNERVGAGGASTMGGNNSV